MSICAMKKVFHANISREMLKWKKAKLLSRVRLFLTPSTVIYQPPLSVGFSRQEYWSGLPFPSAGDLSDPGIEPKSPTLQSDTLPSEPPGKSSMPIYVAKHISIFQDSSEPSTDHDRLCTSKTVLRGNNFPNLISTEVTYFSLLEHCFGDCI